MGGHNAKVIFEILIYSLWVVVGTASNLQGQQALIVEHKHSSFVCLGTAQVEDHTSVGQDLVRMGLSVLLDPAADSGG
jgi:hypothetical protein